MMSFAAGVGFANVDLLYGGMSAIPQESEEIYARDFNMKLGGGIPATMINLGRLGIPVRLGSFTGHDFFSKFAEEKIKETGVEYRNLYSGDGMPVTLTSAIITANDRAFVSYTDGAEINEKVIEDVYSVIKGAKVADMDANFIDAYKRAKTDGTKIVFDMGWDGEMTLEKYKECLEIADFYTPNTKEALKITGADTVEKAVDILSDYFEYVIIKLDKKGTLVKHNGKSNVIEPLPGITRIDSTGAGDAFMTGFLYGLYNDMDVCKCAAYGNVLGGLCVAGYGCLIDNLSEELVKEQVKKIL